MEHSETGSGTPDIHNLLNRNGRPAHSLSRPGGGLRRRVSSRPSCRPAQFTAQKEADSPRRDGAGGVTAARKAGSSSRESDVVMTGRGSASSEWPRRRRRQTPLTILQKDPSFRIPYCHGHCSRTRLRTQVQMYPRSRAGDLQRSFTPTEGQHEQNTKKDPSIHRHTPVRTLATRQRQFGCCL